MYLFIKKILPVYDEMVFLILRFLHTYLRPMAYNVFCFCFLVQEPIVPAGEPETVTTCTQDKDQPNSPIDVMSDNK